jgi:hypothetical protein
VNQKGRKREAAYLDGPAAMNGVVREESWVRY